MHILLCSSYPHLPDTRGGLQTSTDELCLALQDKGVQVTVLCGALAGPDGNDGTSVRRDVSLGYPVIRAADPLEALPLVAAALDPAAIIVQSGYSLAAMLAVALETGCPTAVYLHNMELHRIGGTLPPDPAILYIANSRFTAERWRALFGIAPIILPPVVRPARYQVDRTGDRVLFVNPVPEKGIERVASLAAANPDVPFLIAESWQIGDEWRAWLRQRFGGIANVEWRPATEDVRELFADSRLLLMPSVWEEAYGRTVIEAQLSGLPVLASSRGALVDTVGAGGLVLDVHASVQEWSHALRSLWDDGPAWRTASQAAVAHARGEVRNGLRALDDVLTRLAQHSAR
ncbi:glycosyltransferase family 4 protein [Caenispirillum bisanense]|uniref:glycosyltransferase family 4 protein n=1 Tax=Caenispirillum bisanense TaxID=414052 RepID=UPI0031DCE2F3